ncbi:hypothetical protein [Agrococcus carbonis]|uniref:Uncharacterized protein n=1 Tax=Agrococcus carbonis TaxID=684552 RepID=A0A1H1M0M1_9MICO|nr:hypothetical protein [Agrococcus carbonis]SDR80291.1 hypothetical protein SAMN04489719_0819 [Agrococcus carbonis]
MTGAAGEPGIDARLRRRRRALGAALAVAAATTVVTGCAHALGGGAAPDALLLATAAIVTLLVLGPVLGERASGARRVVGVAIAQLLQHVLYSLPGTAGSGGHVHDAGAALQAATVGHAHASMPLAHVAAGLITLGLLRAVPRAVDALLEAMSLRRAEAALDAPLPAPRHRASVIAAVRRPSALDVLRSAVQRRGPPLPVV